MITVQKEQFANYIMQYERLIISICLSFTNNYFDAEDLAQETFIAASRNIDRFDSKNMKAWLTTIAANKCKDYLKSPGRKISCISNEDMELLEDSRSSPEEVLAEKDSQSRVQFLCSRLKDPYNKVAADYFCNNRKLSEIAQETGQNLKTIQTQLYRAKGLLKILWKEEFP